MNTIAEKIKNIRPSATLKMAKLSRELAAQGKEVISLSLGQPDFDTPEYIKQAAIKALQKGYTKYTPVAGIPELREAIVNFYEKLFGVSHYSPENTMVSVGAKHSIVNVFLSLLNEGDEVILFAPYWVSYYPMVQIAGGVPVVIDTTEDDFKINLEKLKKHISPRTKVVLLNSPSNPSGIVFSKEETDAVLDLLKSYENIYIISDEIYHLITYGEEFYSVSVRKDLKERLIIVSGVGKAFAMTGWRIGFMLADEEVISACEKVQGQFTSGATSISQWAATEALTKDLSEVEKMRKEFQKRRDFVVEFLRKELPEWKFILPEGAFYLYPDISYYFGKKTPQGKIITNSDDFAMELLNSEGVAVVSGEAFGTQKHIRISYATSREQLKKAFEKIKNFCNSLV